MSKYPHAKVIMCSAMGQQGMVVEAIQSGAKDFIVKQRDAVTSKDCVSNLTLVGASLLI